MMRNNTHCWTDSLKLTLWMVIKMYTLLLVNVLFLQVNFWVLAIKIGTNTCPVVRGKSDHFLGASSPDPDRMWQHYRANLKATFIIWLNENICPQPKSMDRFSHIDMAKPTYRPPGRIPHLSTFCRWQQCRSLNLQIKKENLFESKLRYYSN